MPDPTYVVIHSTPSCRFPVAWNGPAESTTEALIKFRNAIPSATVFAVVKLPDVPPAKLNPRAK